MPAARPYPAPLALRDSSPTLRDCTDYDPPGSSVQETLQARILEWAAVSLTHGPQLPGAPLPRELYHLRFQERTYHRPVKSRRPRVCRVSGSGGLLEHHSLEKPPAPAYTSTPQEQQGPSLMPRGTWQRELLFSNLLSLHAADTPSRETRVSPEGLGKAQQVAFLMLRGVACRAGARGGPQGTSLCSSVKLHKRGWRMGCGRKGAAGPRPAGSVAPSWGLRLGACGLQRCSRSAGSAGADPRRGTGACDGTGCGREMNGVRS